MYTYNATLIRVVDADTVKVLVDLGFRIFRQITLRLADINAPELKTEAGKISKQALIDYLGSSPFIIQTAVDPGSYDRYTAVVWKDATVVTSITGVNVNDWLVEKGYAEPYHYKW